jgi:hemerythrin superfamily protein
MNGRLRNKRKTENDKKKINCYEGRIDNENENDKTNGKMKIFEKGEIENDKNEEKYTE